MISVAVFPEEFVDQVGGTVDDEMLIGEITGRVDATEQFDHTETVERAVHIMNGTDNFLTTVLRGGISLLDGEILSENSFEIADMTGSDELIPAADTKIEVSGRLGGQIDSEGGGFS